MKVYCLPKVLASENMAVLTVYRWFSLLSLKKKNSFGGTLWSLSDEC